MRKSALIFLCLFTTTALQAQEPITEARYAEKDSLLRSNYEKQYQELNRLWETMPHKRDSLQQIFNNITQHTFKKVRELAVKYASVPSGLERLFAVREQVPKETLQKTLQSLAPDMQESFYGQLLQEYIQNNPITEGDSLFYFPATLPDGKPFDWTITHGKQILLLYGGLECMGEEGRLALEQLFRHTSREILLVIIYQPVASPEQLQALSKAYPAGYIHISDFKQDASPLKIKYGAQATPTCFLTDNRHIVRVKCLGLQVEKFKQFINITY